MTLYTSLAQELDARLSAGEMRDRRPIAGTISPKEFVRIYSTRLASLRGRGVIVEGLAELVAEVDQRKCDSRDLTFIDMGNGDRFVELNVVGSEPMRRVFVMRKMGGSLPLNH